MKNAMRIPMATVIAAAGLSFALTSAHADAQLWDGVIVVTAATPQCLPLAEQIHGTALRAIFRARLKRGDPEAAVIFQTNNLSHIYVLRSQKTSPTLSGAGEYCGIDFDPGIGESTTWLGGKYNITVTPATVTASTPQIRSSGKVTKFGNIPGCTVEFRGAFQRRP